MFQTLCTPDNLQLKTFQDQAVVAISKAFETSYDVIVVLESFFHAFTSAAGLKHPLKLSKWIERFISTERTQKFFWLNCYRLYIMGICYYRDILSRMRSII